MLVGITDFLHRIQGRADAVLLLVEVALRAHIHFERNAKRIYAAYAYPVQTARNLVAVLVKLAASVQYGQYYFEGRLALLGVPAYGNTPAVVTDGNRIIFVDGNLNQVAVPGQGLVDGVIHHFPHQVVEAFDTRIADVHAGALAHRLQPFQHLNAIGRVVGGGFLFYYFTHAREGG